MEKITIYIADDNDKVLNNAIERWDWRGVNAQGFASGSALLDALNLAETLPTAVIADFVMEGGGDELLYNIRKKFPELPVIIYSGLDTQGSMAAYTKGAYAVMQKPLDFNELHDTVKELAEQDQAFRRLVTDVLTITKFDSCLVWQFDKAIKKYKIVSWSADMDRDFIRTHRYLENGYARVERLKFGNPDFIAEVTNEQNNGGYKKVTEAKARNWVSLMAIPLMRNGKLIGWIDSYKKHKKHEFRDDGQFKRHTTFLQQYAAQAVQALHSSILVQHQRIMHETNQNLAGTLHNELIFDNILSKIIEVTGADCGWIYEYATQEKLLHLGKCYGFNKDCADEKRTLDKGGITGKVARTGESLLVPDISKPSIGYKPEDYIPIPPDLPIKSVLSVPLRRRERTLGVLTIKSIHLDFFTQDDSQLLTALASIAAICMDRAKLIRHLGEISRRAQEGTNFKSLADYIVYAVHDLTEADVNLWMMSTKIDEGDDWVRIISSSKKDGGPEFQDYLINGRAPTAKGTSLIAKALHEDTHVIIKDLNEPDKADPPFYNREAVKTFDWRSFLVVPLIGKKGEKLGALSLSSNVRNNFNEDDGRLIRHFADQATLALQEQEHITILQELTQVGQDLSIGLPGAKELSQKVVDMARTISGADMTVLYPYDMENNDFYDRDSCVFSGRINEGSLTLTEKPRTDGLAAFIRIHSAIIVDNLDEDILSIRLGLTNPIPLSPSDPRHIEATRHIRTSKFIKKEQLHSFIGISLMATDRNKGENLQEVAVLYLNYFAAHYFNEQKLQVLDIFCNQIANVMHRNRLYVSLDNQREVMESIHKSGLHILSVRDEKKRLEKIIEEAVSLLKGNGGKIYLVANGRQDIKLVAHQGYPPNRLRKFMQAHPAKGMAAEVLKTRRPLIVNNYPDYPNAIPDLTDLFHSVVEVPLLIGNDIIGVLGVSGTRKRKFNENDVNALMQLAGQAAIAIYNSQIYNELDAIYQTGIQIATQADMKDMADKVLNELRRVIQYDRASFQVIRNNSTPRELLAQKGYSNKLAHADLLRPLQEDNLVQPIIAVGKPYILSNVQDNKSWDPQIEETLEVKSWICIPLMHKGKALGAIMLDNYKEGYYQQNDQPKLERFATFAAVALYNAQMGQLHLDELQQFAKRTLNLKADDTKDKLFSAALGIIHKVFNANSYNLYLSDHDLVGDLKLNGEQNKIFFKELVPGQGLPGLIAIEGETKLYPDDFPAILREAPLSKKGVLFLSPIWKQGTVVGVLEIESKETDNDQSRKSFLSTLTTQLSQAMLQIELRERRKDAIEAHFNPYITGNSINRMEDFYGRVELLNEILSGIERNNFAIIDERRIGKTSLLLRLEYELKYKVQFAQTNVCPVYLSLQGLEANDFYPVLTHKIREALGLNLAFTENHDKYTFLSFKDDFRHLKREYIRAKNGKDNLIVILMDEIDAFVKLGSKIQEQLRSILSVEKMLKVVMAGYDVDLNTRSLTSPWYNFLKIKKIGAFNLYDATQLIVEPVAGIYTFHSEAINLILGRSELKPWNIQMMCSESITAMYKRLKSIEKEVGDSLVILPEDVPITVSNS